MTFAFGGAGVHTVSKSAPTLAAQVNMFTSLVNDGVISKDQLRRSIALVAVSGNDYLNGADVGDAHLSTFNNVSSSRLPHTVTLHTDHQYITSNYNLSCR
jgi:hypothetical protein